MRDLFELAPWLLPILFILGAILLVGIASFVPVRLWIEAWAAGVSVGLTTLVGMRLRKVSPAAVIRPLINATKAGLTLGTDGLEAHYLAGGNVDRVVKALISADKAGIDLTFQRAAAIDLAGRDVLEAVQVSVNPKVIQTPKVAAMAKDGIQLIALARVTVRANIHRLVGGAGEETILARVGEGIVSTIGSSASHKAVLENPDNISKTVLAKGLDSGTAFEILSIDIADVDVGKNIGAELQTDQAEADKRIAQAKAEERRAMAVALEQEMKARTQEMRAKVVEAEAQVPLAMADAFRQGHMGVMDYASRGPRRGARSGRCRWLARRSQPGGRARRPDGTRRWRTCTPS
ncbi:MAG: flotillin-like protein FloA [Gemmatimonadetes bacterium]|nr:flotillin-like protein FloA [Gemmatimonadota bacterium]